MDKVDLREYFPDIATNIYRRKDGSEYSRYTFVKSPAGFLNTYNTYLSTGKPGYHYSWAKAYFRNGAYATKTYAILHMADDKSITECGDWYSSGATGVPDVVLGYKDGSGNNSGLKWSGVGGIDDAPTTVEMFTASQNSPGAAYQVTANRAFSRSGLIEKLDTYTPPFGRDVDGIWRQGGAKTYNDVVHIVMYHGTKIPGNAVVRCQHPLSACGAYYQSYKDYNSYAIELWLARGVGIIQENTPFIEDGTYWNSSNCIGGLFTANPYAWSSFIDE